MCLWRGAKKSRSLPLIYKYIRASRYYRYRCDSAHEEWNTNNNSNSNSNYQKTDLHLCTDTRIEDVLLLPLWQRGIARREYKMWQQAMKQSTAQHSTATTLNQPRPRPRPRPNQAIMDTFFSSFVRWCVVQAEISEICCRRSIYIWHNNSHESIALNFW